MARKKRKKLDLYWPTILVLVIGILVSAGIVGKYAGEYIIGAGNSKMSGNQSNKGSIFSIKTLSKPEILPQNNDMANDGTQVILPPSFNVKNGPRFNSVSYSVKNDKDKKDNNKNNKPKENQSAVDTTDYNIPSQQSSPVSDPVEHNVTTVVDDSNPGKTSNELNKMLDNTSSTEVKIDNTSQFDRVEIDNTNSSNDVQPLPDGDKLQESQNGSPDNGSQENKTNPAPVPSPK